MIASKGNFDLLLHLAQVGTSTNSIESEIRPEGFSKEVEHQDRYRRFKGFKGASTQ